MHSNAVIGTLAAIVACGCADHAYVLLRVEDPLGIAADSTTVAVQNDASTAEATSIVGKRFPVTLTLVDRNGAQAVLWVEALGPADTIRGRGQVAVAFHAGRTGSAVVALAPPCNEDAQCDDGSFCNGVEHCVSRVCVVGERPCPPSPFACVDVSCLEEGDTCIVVPEHDRCDPIPTDTPGVMEATYCDVRVGCIPGQACSNEGAACPIVSACDPRTCISGRCIPQGGLDVDDDNPCNIDYCDTALGAVHVPNPTVNGNVCTLPDLSLGICLNGDCAASQCGDGYTDAARAEACDDGPANSDSTADACRTDCTLPRCGDTVTDTIEACDDGNASPNDPCLPTCVANVCGDGELNSAVEACDDHNFSANDACLPDCTANVCGDTYLNPSAEACDDGNTTSLDGCSADCDYVVWSVDLGSPIATAPVALARLGTSAGLVSNVGVVTQSGELHVVDLFTGAQQWMYDAGATVRAMPLGMLAIGATYHPQVYILSTDGVVHALSLDGPDTMGAPAWTRSLGHTAANVVGLGGQAAGANGVIAVTDDGSLFDVNYDGTLGTFDGTIGSSYPYAVGALGACPAAGCAPTISNPAYPIDPMGIIVPLGNIAVLVEVQTPCPPATLTLSPGEVFLDQIAFVGTHDTNITADDKAYAATSTNRVVQLSFSRPSDCNSTNLQVDWGFASGTTLTAAPAVLNGAVTGTPREVYFGGSDGRLRRIDVVSGAQPSAVTWTFDSGAGSIDTTPTLTADTVFVGDSAGYVHAVNVDDGSSRWSVVLDAPLSGSVIATRGVVVAATTAGRVYALERGSLSTAPTGSWSRQGANLVGSAATTNCNATPPVGIIGIVIVVLWRRRRIRSPHAIGS